MRIHSKGELLDQWENISRRENLQTSSTELGRIRGEKEKWFSDAFMFLVKLPEKTHIWCSCYDIMEPLLETFHDYPNDQCSNSPIKLLWRRISKELRICIHCITQHHEAQATYSAEFESDSVVPLLNILLELDEERLTLHLRDINMKILEVKYNTVDHNSEVISLIFEVLMFPYLLDDESLVNEFQPFLEAIDQTNELTLSGNQRYPGIYVLLFLKRERVRSIGLRLAGNMGKMSKVEDLEPLQLLLKKCMATLEGDVINSYSSVSRPRLQLERITVWLGLKALLGFLGPTTFEEGILEKYPVFLSIVLNHVSDDSVESTHAVACLRILLEMMGCKVWLRSTFSPSVMRNTLIGQCFHTRNERSHNEIFDLFEPFLQSLEELQDGDHERQRRLILYFLLHQVTQSSNFSGLMRKKAQKIALIIINRGYKMMPACPPYECSHIWGPSLINSLRDAALHSSLRQPAFDLLCTILICDAAALSSSKLNLLTNNKAIDISCFDYDDDDVITHNEQKDVDCWTEFSSLNKKISQECGGWMCIPLIWFTVLVDMDPFALSLSVFKAVIWTLSRFSIIKTENEDLSVNSVKEWILSNAGSVACSFDWEIPNGCDDGADGKLSKNSVRISTSCNLLTGILKRCTMHFVTQTEKGEFHKQLRWEPRMTEFLILLLIDPNDNVRQVARIILEYLSKSQRLVSGLHFLLSSGCSLYGISLGLQHASEMVLADAATSNFHNLHHLFFIVHKLIGDVSCTTPKNSGKCLPDGGFLHQPGLNSSESSSSLEVVNSKSWTEFCEILCAQIWPCTLKCIIEGKAFMKDRTYQMTCVRLLELLPVVVKNLLIWKAKNLRTSEVRLENFFDFKWLQHVMEWMKSPLMVISKHWKQALLSVLKLFKGSSLACSAQIIRKIEEFIMCDNLVMDELQKQASSLAVSLSLDNSNVIGKTITDCLNSKTLTSQPKKFDNILLASTSDGTSHGLQASIDLKEDVIILSDDDVDVTVSSDFGALSHSQPTRMSKVEMSDRVIRDDMSMKCNVNKEQVQGIQTLTEKVVNDTSPVKLEGHDGGLQSENLTVGDLRDGSGKDSVELLSRANNVSQLSNASRTGYPIVQGSSSTNHSILTEEKGSDEQPAGPSLLTKTCRNLPDKTHLKSVDDQNPVEQTHKEEHTHSQPIRLFNVAPKRQVIQFKMPVAHVSGNIRNRHATKRFKPARLDDWYKSILEVDYFSIVGLKDEEYDKMPTGKLKAVPKVFTSPDEYVEIFRPLVLEEFKAQLQNSYSEASSSDEISSTSLRIISVERVDEFHFIRGILDETESVVSRACSEHDLVLLTKYPFYYSYQPFHVIGKVERREKDNKNRSNVIIVIRFYLQNSERLLKAKLRLTERTKWYISRVMSIIPQLREFQALSSLNDIPLLPVILNPAAFIPRSVQFGNVGLEKLSQQLQQKLKSQFNRPQLHAISVATQKDPTRQLPELSLIQGPPGTGKTKTIVALVSVLLDPDISAGLDEKDFQRTSGMSVARRTHVREAVAFARAWQDAAIARQLVEEETHAKKRDGMPCRRRRLLICAQSNAAVDELVSRISSGFYGSDGSLYKPYLVRVGTKGMHADSLPYFIDTIVDQHLAEENTKAHEQKSECNSTSVAIRSNLEKLMENIRLYETQRSNLPGVESQLSVRSPQDYIPPKNSDKQPMSEIELSKVLQGLYAEKKSIYQELADALARERKNFEDRRGQRQRLRKSIIREVEILVTTLSGCGGEVYSACLEPISSNRFGKQLESYLFDAVIIDEAAQALEPATLIPLQLLKSEGAKCIMVGDPKQLPATVFSKVASQYLYECSMFERLQQAGYPVQLLTMQYRMHPEISCFPSLHFYDGKLVNGCRLAEKSAAFHENMFLRPFLFVDVIDGQEQQGNSCGSLSNEAEVEAAIELIKFLSRRYPSETLHGRLGIISPYRSQVSMLRKRFGNEFGPSIFAGMEFNTIDGFQGREVDMLILSTVRASSLSNQPEKSSNSIGFVSDIRRMNVALTRARLSLWVVGNAKTLQRNVSWAALVNNARERKLLVAIKRPYSSSIGSSDSFKQTDASVSSRHAKEEYGNCHRLNSGSRYVHGADRYAGSGSNSSKRPVDAVQSSTVESHKENSNPTSLSADSNFAELEKRRMESKRNAGATRKYVDSLSSTSLQVPKAVHGRDRITGRCASNEGYRRNFSRTDPAEVAKNDSVSDTSRSQRAKGVGCESQGKSAQVPSHLNAKHNSEKQVTVRSNRDSNCNDEQCVTGSSDKISRSASSYKGRPSSDKDRGYNDNLSSGASSACNKSSAGIAAEVEGSKQTISKRTDTFTCVGHDSVGETSQRSNVPPRDSKSLEGAKLPPETSETESSSDTNNLLASRKRQRSAVDALLSSSLISTRSTEISKRAIPAKISRSETRSSHPTNICRNAASSSRVMPSNSRNARPWPDKTESSISIEEEWEAFKDLVWEIGKQKDS